MDPVSVARNQEGFFADSLPGKKQEFFQTGLARILTFSLVLAGGGLGALFSPQSAEAAYINTVVSSFTVSETTQRWVPSRTVGGVFFPSGPEDITTEIGQVEIQHPDTVLCQGPTCTISYSYRYAPIGNSFDYFAFSFKNLSSGSSAYLGIFPKTTNWTQRQYSFTPQLGTNVALQFEITSLGTNENDQSVNVPILFVSGKTLDTFTLATDLSGVSNAVRKQRIYNAGKFKTFEYGLPSKVTVTAPCMTVPIAVAAVDIASGAKDNSQVWNQSSVTVSVVDRKKRREIARVSLAADSAAWATFVVNDQLNVEICGLKDERKVKRNYRFLASFYTNQYGLASTLNTRQDAVFQGVVKYSTLNCLKGQKVRVVRAAAPVCPETFEETDLKVANGKLVLTTIKCLRGVDVINVTAPEPDCPNGYSRTTLPTKNGKIKSTITCVKGLDAIKVTNFNPRCPVGFKKFEDG